MNFLLATHYLQIKPTNLGRNRPIKHTSIRYTTETARLIISRAVRVYIWLAEAFMSHQIHMWNSTDVNTLHLLTFTTQACLGIARDDHMLYWARTLIQALLTQHSWTPLLERAQRTGLHFLGSRMTYWAKDKDFTPKNCLLSGDCDIILVLALLQSL